MDDGKVEKGSEEAAVAGTWLTSLKFRRLEDHMMTPMVTDYTRPRTDGRGRGCSSTLWARACFYSLSGNSKCRGVNERQANLPHV